jgi:hypothetical protein
MIAFLWRCEFWCSKAVLSPKFIVPTGSNRVQVKHRIFYESLAFGNVTTLLIVSAVLTPGDFTLSLWGKKYRVRHLRVLHLKFLPMAPGRVEDLQPQRPRD